MDSDKIAPKVNATPCIHQILITDDLSPTAGLPAALDVNRQDLLQLYPRAQYKLWLKDELREFLRAEFDAAVLAAFDALKPYAFKADLARYCLLFAKGGLYVDLGVRLMKTWDVPEEFGFAAFKELNFTSKSWAIVQNGLIWSRPARRELEIAIRWIAENCERRFYGRGALYPTGPVLFGRAIVAAMAERGQDDAADDQWIGEYRWVTPDGGMKNDAYVSPDHTVVAFRTKAIPGDLRHLGLLGTNNYRAMWARRQIYGERAKVWTHTDDAIRLRNGKIGPLGVVAPLGAVGCLTFGPYANLAPGAYRLRVIFSEAACKGDFRVTVCAAAGAETFASAQRSFSPVDQARALDVEFTIAAYARGVEFVTETFGDFEGAVAGFELTPLAPAIRRWNAADSAISLLQGRKIGNRIEIGHDVRGRVLHGPYEVIEPGLYELKFLFSVGAEYGRLRGEICVSRGNKYLHIHDTGSSRSQRPGELAFRFNVENEYDDFEFRLEVLEPFSGGVAAVELLTLDFAQQEAV